MREQKKLYFLLLMLVGLGFVTFGLGRHSTENQIAQAIGEPRRIMFAGDSVTYGAYEPRGGYRYFLEQKMITDACNNYSFVGPYTENSESMIEKNHAGLSGQNTLQFLNNLHSQQLVARFKVDSLYIMLGINDYFYGNWDQASVWMPGIISEAKLQNPNIKIYLLAATGLNPSVYTDPDYALAQSYYNRGLKQVADENVGKNVYFIDTSSLASNMFSDGEHPNSIGYGKIADEVYGAVGRCLNVDDVSPSPVSDFTCNIAYGTCGCVGSDCRNEGGQNSDWRCCHRECINYACRTVYGPGNNFCDPPDGTSCATTAIPDFTCNIAYGTCGCVGSDCRNEGGQNSDWRCCHRECINYACRTVYGPGNNFCDPPDGTSCGK